MSVGASSSFRRTSRTPALACRTFTESLGAGELEAAASCFARDGCLVTPDATAVRGRERIRDVLAQLIALNVKVSVEFSTVLAATDLALARERWTIRFDGAERAPLVQRSAPTLVLRRMEIDWRIAIAILWGMGEGAPSSRAPLGGSV